jgi:chain length determinant protein EpsF
MTINQFFAILRARWIALSVTLGVIVALAAMIASSLPTRYTATSAIVVDVRPDPVAGGVGALSSSFMATQVDIIESERVASRVVSMLKLAENQELREQWQTSTGGRGSFESWLGNLLQKYLEVLPSKQSNVLSVSYTAEDAAFAAALTNAFVQAYLDTSLELRVTPARQFSGFFDARAKQFRDALEKAQVKLSDFQKEKGLIATAERIDIEDARLSELSSQLVALQAISAESLSRQAQARISGDQMGEVLGNSLISGLKADAARQEARLQELNARLGEAHPQVQELKASIAETRARIETEIRRVTGGVGISSSINLSREAQVRASLDAQRNKVLRLKETRDEASVLMRDVDSAQRAYDTVLARLTQSSLESEATMTNLSVLSPAVEPPFPSFPRVRLIIGAAIVMGLLLGVCVALVREWLDRRVRTLDDVALFEGAPLLLTMPGTAKTGLFRKQPVSLMRQRVLGQLTHAPAKA